MVWALAEEEDFFEGSSFFEVDGGPSGLCVVYKRENGNCSAYGLCDRDALSAGILLEFARYLRGEIHRQPHKWIRLRTTPPRSGALSVSAYS
jgi:hypothetical protein